LISLVFNPFTLQYNKMKGCDNVSKKSINFEVETRLVKKVDVVLNELGVSMPEAITMYLEQIVNKHSIPVQKCSYLEDRSSIPNIWIDEAVEAYEEWF